MTCVTAERLIGAEQVGLCRHCRRPLFATTRKCPAQAWSKGRPIPRPNGDPPCPVEDGTLAGLIRNQTPSAR